jgi:ankyrin repeat protein
MEATLEHSGTTDSRLGALLDMLGSPRSAYRPLPTSLTDAALRGDVTAAQLHLNRGADIRERTIGFASPLHAACGRGRLEMAQFLFERGAPLQVENEMFTCIHFAAGAGHTEIVRWALDSGFPPARAASALRAAAGGGHYETVKLLLDHGVEQEKAESSDRSEFKSTVARDAEAAGSAELATFIREGAFDAARHIAQVDRVRRERANLQIAELPLADSAARETVRSEALEQVQAVSNPDRLDSEGVPLLVRAVITREPMLVRAVLDRGADPNLRAEFGGLTALTEGCALGAHEIVTMLVASGADINLADGSGRTPLMHAAARGEPDIVELLLASGVDPKAKDLTGLTALKQCAGPYADRIASSLKLAGRPKGKSRRP